MRSGSLPRVILCALALCLPAVSGADQPQRVTVGYSARSFPDVDLKDATAAFQLWTKKAAAEVGVAAECRIYNDTASMVDDLRSGRVDLVSMTSTEYLKVESRIHAEPAFGATRSGKLTENYLLLVRAASRVADLADLEGQRLAATSAQDLALIYLDTLLLRRRLPMANRFFSELLVKSKTQEALLSVFFGQADACVVAASTFRTMVELNPQVGTHLKVLASSPDLLVGMTVFRADLSTKTKQIFREMTRHLNDDPQFSQFLVLFRVEHLTTMKESDIDSTRRLLDEYRRLKER
jgi:ABC-type phosphate/phosphonate transport system substrate-binding protein